MSTTQHPLTDEQIMDYHELPGSGEWFRDVRYWFDAGREHERATVPADPHHDHRPWGLWNGGRVCVGDEVRRTRRGITRIAVVGRVGLNGGLWTAEDHFIGNLGDGTWYVRRAAPTATTPEKDTPMTEITPTAEPLARTLLAVPEGHGAPHHDAGKIKADDIVMQLDEDGFIRAGKAHYQDGDGNWRSESGKLITRPATRADRPDALTVWPAPTPPAVEVEMPSEHPAHLRDVEGWDGERFAYMALDGGGRWCGVDQDGVARVWPLRWIAAATLPDGTRARRDGTRANGEPRFVKTQEV